MNKKTGGAHRHSLGSETKGPLKKKAPLVLVVQSPKRAGIRKRPSATGITLLARRKCKACLLAALGERAGSPTARYWW